MAEGTGPYVTGKVTKGGLVENARACVKFVWANTQGSYSEANYGVRAPASEVLVSGNLT